MLKDRHCYLTIYQKRYQEPEYTGKRSTHREGEAGAQRRGGTRDGRIPQWTTGTWVQAEGGNGGENGRGNGSSCRHAAQGEETRGGSWQVEGVVDVQVDGVPRRERRWGAGVTER